MYVSTRTTALTFGFAFSILFFHYISPAGFRYSPRHEPEVLEPLTCTPDAWSAGSWRRRPDALPLTTVKDVYAISGFTGCAANGNTPWHIGIEKKKGTEVNLAWRGNVSAYDWQPGPGCADGEVSASPQRELLTSLVEKGGWLLQGDSLTGEHFFSLACILHPHVITTPDFTAGKVYDRDYPQNMYLNPESPLLPSLTFPKGFDIKKTPIITYNRNDLLFNRTEVEMLHRLGPGSVTGSPLFSNEGSWNGSPLDYMKTFLSPLPTHNYRVLIANTAGHWTRGHLAGIKTGDRGIHHLFRIAVNEWVYLAALHLDQDKTRTKEIVVRPYLPGTQDCHNPETLMGGPIDEVVEHDLKMWNWAWIPLFNSLFEEAVLARNHPRIHYLGIERPGRLRPDAHATSDCLHLTVGAGVVEGWTHYIHYYLHTWLPTYRGTPKE